jgi:hypothetical protein
MRWLVHIFYRWVGYEKLKIDVKELQDEVALLGEQLRDAIQDIRKLEER